MAEVKPLTDDERKAIDAEMRHISPSIRNCILRLLSVIDARDAEVGQLTAELRTNTEELEIADVLIRIFDFCGRRNIDLGTALAQKLRYNRGRERRHGEKRM